MGNSTVKVLFLGYTDSPLIGFLRSRGEEVVATDKKIDQSFVAREKPDFVLSYGYRYIIRKDILDLFPKRIINLHIAYLPWNKGADPNFWSNFEGTPAGVTIHDINEGIDTGDIIAQERIEFDSGDTLSTSYTKLRSAIEELLKKNWERIKAGTAPRIKQNRETGNLHLVKDLERYKILLARKGWDTPIAEVQAYGLVARMGGGSAMRLFHTILTGKPEKTDAIIFLQGDQLDRAKKVLTLFWEEAAPVVFVTGNNELIGRGKRNEEEDLHLDVLRQNLVEGGIPESALIVDDQAFNTADQAVNVLRVAKEKKWKSIILVTSPYHVLRSYLTFVKKAREAGWDGRILIACADLPWHCVPAGRKRTALSMLELELEKLKAYAAKGDVATAEEGLALLHIYD